MFGTILMQRVVSAALCAATLVGLPGCTALQTPEADRTRPAQTQTPERTPPDNITFGTRTMNTWHTFEHCLDCFRYFAYSGFRNGVMAMAETDVFTLADSEQDGNLSFREQEGYAHDGRAANEYMYNALRFFWN